MKKNLSYVSIASMLIVMFVLKIDEVRKKQFVISLIFSLMSAIYILSYSWKVL